MEVPMDVLYSCRTNISNILLMDKDLHSPKYADPAELWAHLRIKYRDGDELVDEDGLIWDVWKKNSGFILYCSETKEVIDIPKPKSLGG